jgi:glycosyltransferase involved in cell wall biosynthesis
MTFSQIKKFDASLIISVYRDVAKLRCILETLKLQTHQNFEIVVSEDGEDPKMASLLEPYIAGSNRVQHLTQPDKGFRKNRALNSAVRNAQSDYLIFIDGDCVPHPCFVSAHLKQSEPLKICAGRRVELGPVFSDRLINRPDYVVVLADNWRYLIRIAAIVRDSGKNPESGLFSPLLHGLKRSSPLSIVGCNFSCSKRSLQVVNGFNEDFESPGLGEDSDIEWRMKRAGFYTKNVKFLTPLFHLHHSRSYQVSQANLTIYNQSKSEDQWRCVRGLEIAPP